MMCGNLNSKRKTRKRILLNSTTPNVQNSSNKMGGTNLRNSTVDDGMLSFSVDSTDWVLYSSAFVGLPVTVFVVLHSLTDQ